MCFVIRQKEKPAMQVAKEDIKVYKVIDGRGWGWLYNLHIDGYPVKWERGWHYTEDRFEGAMKYQEVLETWEVNQHAFHSKVSYEETKNIFPNDNTIIVEMYIPKGGMFYKNETEYVSSDLVWY